MTPKLGWYILRTLRRLWVRVVSFAVLAVVTAIVAQLVGRFVPTAWSLSVGADAVGDVLNILASSMLAVTTFSLAIATSAFSAAARTATPRATALLQEDPTAQNVLATFLGAFLFSLVGIFALEAGYYSKTGLLVLFVVTGLIVLAVVMALLRWISHLMTFGRMEDTLDRVEHVAKQALDRRVETPYLGGRPLLGAVPVSCVPVLSDRIGYIQHVDVGTLNRLAEQLRVKIWLAALPGGFVHLQRPLAHVDRETTDDKSLARLRAAFAILPERDFQQDPRFGLIVLSEIGSRALSPGVNDPGTAISVLGRLARVLSGWQEAPSPDIRHASVFVPPILSADLIGDAFRPMMRDGLAVLEVQIRLHKTLEALASMSPAAFADPARVLAAEALARARDALAPSEFERLQAQARTG